MGLAFQHPPLTFNIVQLLKIVSTSKHLQLHGRNKRGEWLQSLPSLKLRNKGRSHENSSNPSRYNDLEPIGVKVESDFKCFLLY